MTARRVTIRESEAEPLTAFYAHDRKTGAFRHLCEVGFDSHVASVCGVKRARLCGGIIAEHYGEGGSVSQFSFELDPGEELVTVRAFPRACRYEGSQEPDYEQISKDRAEARASWWKDQA